uniref:ATP synthase complex subunit 8 n=1 Tax=Chrysiptera biocellata TaxID=1268085 RepID=A0A3S5X9E1_9TELE|nr:ATP synthase F0 subunit 8 [Chrysiptera biocellata]ALO81651.1 ATP synthase F0 subunit 8 [Chrysiptera biocellata]
MPQLNPLPWFSILVFSWLIFLLIIPAKVTAHAYPNELIPQTMEKVMAEPWSWPWS